MVDLALTRRFSPTAFLAWWLSELAGLVPESLRRGFRRRSSILVLEQRGAELTAAQHIGGRQRTIAQMDSVRATDPARRRFGRALARAAKVDTQVVLRLSADKALQRRLEMPWVADSDLNKALYFEIDRQTPFQPQETFFEFDIAERHEEERRLTIDLTIVPRKVFEENLAAFAEWGVVVTAIEVAAMDGGKSTLIDVRDDLGLSWRRGGWYFVNWLLAIIAAGLLAFAFYIPLDARQTANESLKSELQRARARANTALEMRADLDRLVKTERLLLTRKLQANSGVQVLDELTRLLSDDTWIASLQISGSEVRLTGYAPTAASLVSLIDGSKLFATPSFRSPVTQDARSGKERFSLSFELEQPGRAP